MDEYIRNTRQIRILSYPDPSKLDGAAEYSRTLRANFIKIGEIAQINRAILSDVLEPVLSSDQTLTPETIDELNRFSSSLLDASSVESIDIPLSYHVSSRLMKYAVRSGDTALKLRQADYLISGSYSMVNMTKRFGFGQEACAPFREQGFMAADYIRQFCDPDSLASLESEELRELVLVNSRFSVCLYEGNSEDPVCCQENIDTLKHSISLEDNPDIRSLVPDYDWRYHRFRAMEYIAAISEHNNSRGCTLESRRYISDVCDELLEIWDSDPDYYRNLSPRIYIRLAAMRNAYLCGRTDRDEYLEMLAELYRECEDAGQTFIAAEEVFYIIGIPLEYIYALERPSGFVTEENDRVFTSKAAEKLTEEQIRTLTRFYMVIEKRALYTIGTRSLSYLLEFLSLLLIHFIKVPEVSFKRFCLSAMRVLHPPTYVHTCMVGELSKCLCHYVIKYDPTRLAGFNGLNTAEEIRSHKDDILSFTEDAALCHDFGKIPLIDIIFVYGRNLFDFEFDLIRRHTDIGMTLLEYNSSVSRYRDIAGGHHRWYNDKSGYPFSFSIRESEIGPLISIVACADCMDAATDSIGRSYSRGKSLDEYIHEVEDGAGTRYAPYLPDLMKRPEVYESLRKILNERREDYYRLTYDKLTCRSMSEVL